MRSRPTVRLWHGPNVLPGSVVPVTLELLFATETPVDFIHVELRGNEFAGYGGGKSRRTAQWRNLGLRHTLPGKTFTVGAYRYELSFEVPPVVPPSYTGSDAHIRYELYVCVSIPWWPDRTAEYVVPIGFPLMQPYPPSPRVFTSRDESGKDLPSIELSVDTVDVCIDETISGQLSVVDLGARTCRGVDIAIVEQENLREPVTTTRESRRWGRRIFHGRPPEGETIPFSVRIPRDAHPTFKAHLYGLTAFLEAKCDISLGSDIVLRAPLVVRPKLAAPRMLTEDLVAPVGNGRLNRVFSVVAGRQGLTYDAQRRRLEGAAGVVSLAVSLDHAQDGYRRAARFEYPKLGVSFLVEPKRAGNLFGLSGRSTVEIPGYVVTARDPDQVTALATLIGARVAPFDHVYFTDEYAELSQKGDASTVQALSTFTTYAQNFAHELSDAILALPAPRGMEGFVPAWQAYAEQVGGTFSRAAMSISGGRAGFDQLAVTTHFAVHGVPTDTAFVLSLNPPLALDPAGFDPASPSLSADARQLAVALMKDHRAEITPSAIEVSVPGAVPDPAAHGPLVQRLAALAAALRGQIAQVPYR